MIKLRKSIKLVFFDIDEEYIRDFIDQCQYAPIDRCLVSLSGNSVKLNDFREWAEKIYGTSFELCSSASMELTFTVMETMAKLRGYTVKKALFVSNNAAAMELAKKKGFLVLSDLAQSFKLTKETRSKIGFTSGTEDLVIPEKFFDKEDVSWYKITQIDDSAFAYFNKLRSVVIPNTVKAINFAAFCGCKNLVSINIPDSVTKIGTNVFLGCSRLESIKIGSSVPEIGDAFFRSCKSLKSIVLPDSITKIGCHAFSKSGLTEITIPASVKTINVWAFNDCPDLEEIRILGNPEIEHDAFYGVKKILYNGKYPSSKWGAKTICGF